jgi:hypothetical protein
MLNAKKIPAPKIVPNSDRPDAKTVRQPSRDRLADDRKRRRDAQKCDILIPPVELSHEWWNEQIVEVIVDRITRSHTEEGCRQGPPVGGKLFKIASHPD